jgi:hypothetical protein
MPSALMTSACWKSPRTLAFEARERGRYRQAGGLLAIEDRDRKAADGDALKGYAAFLRNPVVMRHRVRICHQFPSWKLNF